METHYYAEGGHSPFGLNGSLGRTSAFLGVLSPARRRAQSLERIDPEDFAYGEIAYGEIDSKSSWAVSASLTIDSQPEKGWRPPMQ